MPRKAEQKEDYASSRDGFCRAFYKSLRSKNPHPELHEYLGYLATRNDLSENDLSGKTSIAKNWKKFCDDHEEIVDSWRFFAHRCELPDGRRLKPPMNPEWKRARLRVVVDFPELEIKQTVNEEANRRKRGPRKGKNKQDDPGDTDQDSDDGGSSAKDAESGKSKKKKKDKSKKKSKSKDKQDNPSDADQESDAGDPSAKDAESEKSKKKSNGDKRGKKKTDKNKPHDAPESCKFYSVSYFKHVTH